MNEQSPAKRPQTQVPPPPFHQPRPKEHLPSSRTFGAEKGEGPGITIEAIIPDSSLHWSWLEAWAGWGRPSGSPKGGQLEKQRELISVNVSCAQSAFCKSLRLPTPSCSSGSPPAVCAAEWGWQEPAGGPQCTGLRYRLPGTLEEGIRTKALLSQPERTPWHALLPTLL